MSKVKNFGPFSVALKLVEFPLFGNYFLDLAKFQDLDVFLFFDFLDLDNFRDLDNFPVFDNFPYFSIDSLSSLMLSTSSAASILLATSIYDDIVVFNIDVSGAAILPKPWMNCQ